MVVWFPNPVADGSQMKTLSIHRQRASLWKVEGARKLYKQTGFHLRFKICNEILKYEILNIKYQIFKMCNEILKGAFFLRCPCWSLCQVFSWKLLHCLMWRCTFFFVFGFPWAFDFFRFGACSLEGEENNFETRADCQKVSLLIGLKRMRKGAMIYFYHIFLEKYLWNILKNSSRTLLKH